MAIPGMITLASILLGTALALPAPLNAQQPRSESRGQLLYTLHCIACHSTQIHWRNERKATDRTSLNAQVRRWQGNSGLQWTEEDVVEVALFLNETIYRFP
jgi:CxxC motif-containing protein (DUF1111 family)